MLGDFIGRRRHCPFKGQHEADTETYKRFRRRIIQRSHREGPSASTPVGPRWRCEPRFKLDAVCQRLELDSPPRHHEPVERVLQGAHQEVAPVGGTSHREAVPPPNAPRAVTAKRRPVTEQGLVWSAGDQENAQCAGCDERGLDLKPFAALNEASLPGGSLMKLLAPSLLNDYYTNLLDCSCNGVVALALGSLVYLWNSETRALLGHLEPSPQPGRPSCQTRSVSCVCWSTDGRALCIGTRRGEVQLWDVEHKQNMSRQPSHLSVVGALSWKQQLLSSGSVLGHIHHLDPRAPAALVGSAVQEEGICSLQWSPGGERLASGSTGGLLHIWDGDIAGVTGSRQPVATVKQASAVKAMGWCPWQGNVIATGGGWKDGELRIWDTQSGSCVTSVNTNSQICSLQWADRKRHLITGHGLPHHQVTCWQFPSLSPIYQLTVVCHGLAVGQTTSHYFLVQRPLSWIAGREFCQSHYVDFAVLNSEDEYFTLLQAMPRTRASFWVGLQRQRTVDDWKWVDGAELGYQRWNRENQEGCCATLKAALEKDEKLLARRCTESHMVVCQGPVSPPSVSVDSVGTDHVNLSWNISAFMQMTPHGYNVTVNGRTHETLPASGSAFMNVTISNLTSATEHVIELSAFVMRPDDVTGEMRILQSDPTTLQVTTEGLLAPPYEPDRTIAILLKTLKLMSLAPPLFILYHIVKKATSPSLYPDDPKDSDLEVSTVKLIVEETVVEVIPTRTRGVG